MMGLGGTTEPDLGLLVLRIVVGGIFVAQGSRKLFSDPDISHGRHGLERLVRQLGFPLPTQTALVVSLSELVFGSLVMIGLLTQLACIPLAVVLLVAVRAKWSAGFFGGWDWPLAVLGSTVALLLLGPGAISIDAATGLIGSGQ
jgi:putative oxidoreductase